jgi:hypothetical protein
MSRVWFAGSSFEPLTLVLKATGIPKRATLVVLSNVHGNKGILFRGSRSALVSKSVGRQMTVKLNDSGATHALRLKIKQIRFSAMNRLDRNSGLSGHVYEEFSRCAASSGSKQQHKTVAICSRQNA